MPGDPVLVTGGTGVVGRAIVKRLILAGREVRGLARSDRSAAALGELGARPVPGDVLDPASLRKAMDGVGSVLHVAGVNAMCLRDPEPMYRVNVQGPTNVIEAAADAGVAMVVHTSSAAAIGEASGTVGREDSPHRGSYLSHYERSKRLAEHRVLDLAAGRGVRAVIVQPASVQGPGRSTGSARLLLHAVNGRLPVLVDTTISLVDVSDCAEGHLLAETRGVAGERYLLSGATLTTREALALVRGLCGRPERVVWLPRWAVVAAGASSETAARMVGRNPLVCREVVRTLMHGHRYDGSKAGRELGVRYTPIEETFRRTLAWYADRGLGPPPRGAGT